MYLEFALYHIIVAAVGVPVTLGLYQLFKRANKARVRRSEVREYKRLSKIYRG